MVIKSLAFKSGLDESSDTLAEKGVNLIYSGSNSRGKTTLLRLILYSLGFSIPGMKGIDFDSVESEIIVAVNSINYKIFRKKEVLNVESNGLSASYLLPIEHALFLSKLFNYKKDGVLNNLLGILYIDQEKGWTLLNRGTVIGSVKFSIEELLASLNGVDISGLLNDKKKYKYRKNKYEAIQNIQSLKDQISDDCISNLSSDDEESNLSNRVIGQELIVNSIKQSVKDIDDIIKQQKGMFDYIASLNLRVKVDEAGEKTIKIVKDNIVGANENDSYLEARRNILMTQLKIESKKKEDYERALNDYLDKKYSGQLFDNSENDKVEKAEKKLLSALSNIDQTDVYNLIDESSRKLTEINAKIKKEVKDNNNYINRIYQKVLKYASSLNLETKYVVTKDIIFTSDLKSLSGANLSKLVFAFKVAFLKIVEEDLGSKLPFIIDSPSAKELDKDNVALIMKLINDELGDNQVIIASIYDNFVNYKKKIEIKNQAIEKR